MNLCNKGQTYSSTHTSETKHLITYSKLYYKIEILDQGSASYLIRSITNFMFDEVFSQMEYSKATGLLNECVDLLPPDAIPKMVHYSSEHIILGFVNSETRFPGICVKAVELFVNYDYPEASLKVLNFLKNNVSDHCVVTKIILPAQSLNPQSTDIEGEKPAANHTSSIEFSCQFGRKILIWISSIILVTLLLFGICMIVHVLIRIRNIESNVSNTAVETDFRQTHLVSPTTILPNTLDVARRRTLNITTLSDLWSSMSSVHPDENVTLNFFLHETTAWDQSAKIENAYTITKLTMKGPIQFNFLHKILFDLKKLQYVEIINANDLLCQDHSYYRLNFQEVIELPNVKNLILDGFSECLHVYNALTNIIVFNRLKYVHIVNAKITESNQMLVRKLITNSRYDLTGIWLESSRILVPVINNHLNTLPEVKYLRIDFSDNQFSNMDAIGTTFSHIFPKLETFKSQSGYLSWNEVLNLSYCKNLQDISIGIRLMGGINYFSFLEMHSKFQNLRYLEVVFKFEGIDVHNGCIFEGETELKRYLRKLKFDSNCIPRKKFERES